jgi:hypothetical protein
VIKHARTNPILPGTIARFAFISAYPSLGVFKV